MTMDMMQPPLFSNPCSGAVINGPYRYLLWRHWNEGQSRLLWIMLNPSVADEQVNDPTLRRLVGFSRSFGFGGLDVVNLFALRSSSPKALTKASDAIGPENDRYIQEAVARADKIVVAWGNEGAFCGRARTVLARIDRPLLCLGMTKSGYPRHPLFVNAHTELCLFSPEEVSS